MPCASSHHGKFVLPASMLLACLLSFGCGGAVTAASPSGGTATNENSFNLTNASSAAPLATFSPSAIAFGSQILNAASPAQTVTLTNTGTASLSISGISISGDFAQTNNCTATLAANASCSLSVTFMPTVLGVRSGTLTITDNASGSTQSVAVSGTGTAPAVGLSPTSLAFGNQALSTTSAAQTVTLTNTGTASLSISGDFAQTNNCPTTLAANSSCTFTVTFTPTATGARTGALTIADNASGSPQSVALSGTGTTPGQLSASPGSIAFGSVVVDQSGNQTVTISNTGAASVTVSSASTSGPGFSISGLSLPLTLSSNQTASFTVSFGPSNDGSATGSVYLSNNGTGSPTTISLSGTGINPPAHQVSLSWNPSTSQVIGYNVYRGTQSGGPYSQLNSVADSATSFSDESVSAGQTYFYVVTAVDSDNVQSAYSNEATAVIPTP